MVWVASCCWLRFFSCLRDAHVYACSNTIFQTYSAFMPSFVCFLLLFGFFSMLLDSFSNPLCTTNYKTLLLKHHLRCTFNQHLRINETNAVNIYFLRLNRVATQAIFLVVASSDTSERTIKAIAGVGAKEKNFSEPNWRVRILKSHSNVRKFREKFVTKVHWHGLKANLKVTQSLP